MGQTIMFKLLEIWSNASHVHNIFKLLEIWSDASHVHNIFKLLEIWEWVRL